MPLSTCSTLEVSCSCSFSPYIKYCFSSSYLYKSIAPSNSSALSVMIQRINSSLSYTNVSFSDIHNLSGAILKIHKPAQKSYTLCRIAPAHLAKEYALRPYQPQPPIRQTSQCSTHINRIPLHIPRHYICLSKNKLI